MNENNDYFLIRSQLIIGGFFCAECGASGYEKKNNSGRMDEPFQAICYSSILHQCID